MNRHRRIIDIILLCLFVFLYLAFIIGFITTHPLSEKMSCNSNHICNIERQYRWNYKQTEFLTICKDAKIKFNIYNVNDIGDGTLSFSGGNPNCRMSSGRIRMHNTNNDTYRNIPMHITVFSSYGGSFNNSSNLSTKEFSKKITNEFYDYMKGKTDSFVLTKKYNQSLHNIEFTVATVLVICLILSIRII